MKQSKTHSNEITDTSKAPKWILFLGIALFLCGNITVNIFPNIKNSVSDNPLESVLRSYPRVLMLVFVVIIGPVIEEIGFRAWQLKSHVLRYISIIIMMNYVYFVTSSLWMVIVLLPILLWLILIRTNPIKRLIALLLTSLIFALIHIDNYNTDWSMLLSTITLFGFALILNYLTWRYSIIWAFVLHMANNGLAMLAFNQDSETIQIQTADYHMTIQQKKYIDNYKYSYEDNKVTATSRLDDIVNHWMGKYDHDSTYFYIHQERTPLLELSVSMSPHADKKQILDTLISTFHYQFDTMTMSKYNVTIPEGDDTISVSIFEGEKHLNERLEYIMNVFIHDFNLPVYYDKRHDDRIVKINSYKLHEIKAEEFIDALQKANIQVTKDPVNTVKGIKLVPKK